MEDVTFHLMDDKEVDAWLAESKRVIAEQRERDIAAGKKLVTHEDKAHDEWYKQAKEVTDETFPEFFRHLSQDYIFDYDTAVYAAAAAAVGAARATPMHYGLSGFQAGCVMGEFICEYMSIEGPFSLVDYRDMLWPQYAHKFDKVMSRRTFEWLQKKAQEELDRHGAHRVDSHVFAHWAAIVAGIPPFGYRVED